MVEIVVTDEFRDWYEALDDAESNAVYRVVSLLETAGVTLGFPQSSQIKGSHYALRELRTQAKGEPIRIIYAFDPIRQAVLLLGANKGGNDRFYGVIVPQAERLWETYLKEMP